MWKSRASSSSCGSNSEGGCEIHFDDHLRGRLKADTRSYENEDLKPCWPSPEEPLEVEGVSSPRHVIPSLTRPSVDTCDNGVWNETHNVQPKITFYTLS